MNRLDGISELEAKCGYCFKDKSLIKMALSHSSYVNEVKLNKTDDYERLEFLGDAVLELSVSEYLYANRADMREGDMTKLRASLVCEPTLASCARSALNLGDYLLLGKGEDQTGGRGRDSIVSDVFEAIIGAIYLDGGFEEAKRFIGRFVLDDMESRIEFIDSKTRLQEVAQERGYELAYDVIKESGPAHDRRYTVAVLIDGIKKAEGCAGTKKGAEQQAAYAVLQALKNSK